MAYLGTFASGASILAAENNQLNGITWLDTTTTSLTVGSGANVTLTFAAGDVKVDVMSAFTVATSRILPTVGGVYMVEANVTLAANGGAVAYCAILKNGATIVAKNTTNLATAGANSSVGAYGWVTMNGTTDYLTAVVYQSSGASTTSTVRNMGCTLLRKT